MPPPPLPPDLPLFCESCGYSLLHLPPTKCSNCSLLHLTCPECGHHQPLNSPHPYAQRLLSRFRFAYLSASLVFRLAFFGYAFYAWFSIASNTLDAYSGDTTNGPVPPAPASPDFLPTALPLAIYALLFAAIARMFLLRWRNALIVSFVITALLLLAASAGALYDYDTTSPTPTLLPGFFLLLIPVTIASLLGALLAWPLWSGLVRAFLPPRLAQPLLTHQRNLSSRQPPTHEPAL